MRASPSLAVALLLMACSFDDDRSLGSMAKVTAPVQAGTSQGGSTASSATIAAGAPPATTVASCQVKAELCDTGQYCAIDIQCARSVEVGVCLPRPVECPLPSGRETVCGCDGVLYDSLCLAQRAGTSAGSFEFCPAIVCQDELDCTRLSESCASLFDASAPLPVCNVDRCDCQRPSVIQ